MKLQLDQLSVDEKLQLMEDVWNDLCRDEAQVPSPDWHGEVLSRRDARVSRGDATFSDWDQTKRRLRQETEP